MRILNKYLFALVILLMLSGNNLLYSQQSATINIDLLQPTQDTVSKHIYGGFIEFIGDVINSKRGLWAQELQNRGFDVSETTDSTIARSWLKYNSGSNICNWALDSSGYNPNGVYSQKISVLSFLGGKSGISYKIFLTSGIQYNFYTYLKGLNISGTITISLLDTSQQIIDSINFNNINSNWQKYSGLLSSNYSGDALLTISFQEQSDLWIDEASLMPLTAIDGVRKEYIDSLEIFNPAIMRYPGGCFADGSANFWEYGIGDIDKRKSPNWDNHWGAYQRMDFGLDEYMQFCINTGIDPQITVNFGTRDSVDARNLVEYANGDTLTYYGNLRKQNGHPDPYNIKYWEIGNEQYGGWEIGHTTAYNYATRFNGFSNQMKSVDSTIKIIANGDYGNIEWTDTLLSVAGNYMDLISVHQGIPYIPGNDTLYTDQQVYEAMVASPLNFKRGVNNIENKLSVQGLNNVHIALTEWWEDFSCPKYGKHDRSLETAIYAAGLLNVQQQKSHIIKLANRTTFCTIFKEYEPPFSFYLSPVAYVLSMYSSFSGDRLVSYSVVSPFVSSPALSGLPAQDTVPLLDVSVTKNDNKIFINVVNRSLFDSISTTINLQGNNTSFQATVRSIQGNSYLATNDTNHTNITICSDTLFIVSGTSFNYVFAPLSVTGIELNLDTNTNIEELNEKQQCYIYPNPTSGEIIIELPEINDSQNYEFIIYDCIGRNMKTMKIKNAINVINVNLPNGMYFYQVKDNKKFISSGKLIVQ